MCFNPMLGACAQEEEERNGGRNDGLNVHQHFYSRHI